MNHLSDKFLGSPCNVGAAIPADFIGNVTGNVADDF